MNLKKNYYTTSPLYALGTGIYVSNKETKGSVSFCANIANMCNPAQILSNCYSKVFNFVNILKICINYSVHVLCIDRFDPFPYQLYHIAFDELESHCPVF